MVKKSTKKWSRKRGSTNTLYITRAGTRTWRETIRECVTDVAYNVTIAKPRLLLRSALVFAHQLVRSLWYSRTLRLAVSFTLLRSPTMALNSSHHSEWSNPIEDGRDGRTYRCWDTLPRRKRRKIFKIIWIKWEKQNVYVNLFDLSMW